MQFKNYNINEKIIHYNQNIYITKNNNIFQKYIELIILSNISFSLNDTYIQKSDIIKKILNNKNEIDETFLEDLYYNTDFSKKINLELPNKYNNKKIILEDIDIYKKYLFKIDFLELNKNYQEEYML